MAAIAGDELAACFAALFPTPEKIDANLRRSLTANPEESSGFPSKAELLELGRPSQALPSVAWITPAQVSASAAKDILAAIENGRDDRPLAVKAATSSRALAARRANGARPAFSFARVEGCLLSAIAVDDDQPEQ